VLCLPAPCLPACLCRDAVIIDVHPIFVARSERERERQRERAREGDLIFMTKKAAKKLIGSINDSISDPRLCYNTFPQIQGTNLPI
jgi:hypothetical protein